MNQYQELAAKIQEMVTNLRKVDVSKEPSQQDMRGLEALYQAAEDLRTVTNYVLYG